MVLPIETHCDDRKAIDTKMKRFSARSLLSLVTALAVGASSAVDHAADPLHRDLFLIRFFSNRREVLDDIACITASGAGAALDCCDPGDPSMVCSLVSYFALNLSDPDYGQCDCAAVEGACDDMGFYRYLLRPEFGDFCDVIDDCCGDTTTNVQFNGCILQAIGDGDIGLPSSLLPPPPEAEADEGLLGTIQTITCIANNISATFTECCPADAEPTNAVCSALSCVNVDLDDGLDVSYDCDCVIFKDICMEAEPILSLAPAFVGTICSAVSGGEACVDTLEWLIDFLVESCSNVDGCCEEAPWTCGGTDTTPLEFVQCMANATFGFDSLLQRIAADGESV